MKKPVFALALILLGFLQVQAQNPYAALGIEEQVLRYDDSHEEVFGDDTLKTIGYAVYDRINGLTSLFDLTDSLVAIQKIDPSKMARFLSVDPIAREYPELTVYQFASNTPIQAIDLDGLEAFVIHGTTQSDKGVVIQKDAQEELKRITGNTAIDNDFRWNSPIYNNAVMRNTSSKELVKYIQIRRKEMIDNNEITSEEGISLIGYSHGGNVAIQAARRLGKMGIKVNLITLSTPAYNTNGTDAYSGGLDSEDPRGAMEGINAHYQIIHENDDVVNIAGGTEKYNNNVTKNFVITNQQMPFKHGVDTHTEFPSSEKLGGLLKEIPSMTPASSPTFPTPLNPKKNNE